MGIALFASQAILASQATDNDLNRGIGLYPGSPSETFAPLLTADNSYRNVALRRMATHSSSADYNLTAQLLTDGIIETSEPSELEVTTNNGPFPRREKEWTIDGGPYSCGVITGEQAWIGYHWKQMSLRADSITITCTVAHADDAPQRGGAIRAFTANGEAELALSGQWTWATLPGRQLKYKLHSDPNKQTDEGTLPARSVEASIQLGKTIDINQLRLEFDMPGAAYWSISEVKFWNHGEAVTDFLPSNSFHSVWASWEAGRQWVSIDLGAECSFDRVRIHWIEKATEGQLECSADGHTWQKLSDITGGTAQCEEIAATATARYVRLVMTKAANGKRYAISEVEVMGRGGLTAVPHAECQVDGQKWAMNGGQWRIERASEVNATGETLSESQFDDSGWLCATVPATVLMSYVNAQAVPNPNYSDNMFYISESYFNGDFWYRKTFTVPEKLQGRHLFLNLDGINWKADVYLNGKKIDRIEGAFIRGKVEVTNLLKQGDNVLAIRIYHNAHPAAVKEKNDQTTDMNGGLLGADNPTFHATIGWDWISTIRGRDIGIWNDVWLSAEGSIGLADPLVQTKLTDGAEGKLSTMTPTVIVKNNESHAVRGTLSGWIGSIKFEKELNLSAGESREVSFQPTEYAQLSQQPMQLWWPNGYGEPYLYDAGYSISIEGQPTQTIDYKAGIREVTYTDKLTKFQIYVNGVRMTPLGGNWGFSENNLCYRGREYDIAVKYHRDMNFNMIRNWVGQIGDEEFYEACDRYGIMVWQDFWLANPADGPDPYDDAMFLRNATDYVKRIRNHASIAMYCGRNEGDPPASLNGALEQIVGQLHPGMEYIPSSADYGVSGHGPYWALPREEYFTRQTGLLHSERGMPNVMTWEGTRRTLGLPDVWPSHDAWGKHDFTQRGAQRGASFTEIVERGFGHADTASEFCALAQWENYEGYRAMFESSNTQRMGLVIWMSHPCWPTFVWQTYDYYFEPTAAFFACKKACEPVHAQLNSATGKIQIVNRLPQERNLNLKADLMNLSGHVIASEQTAVRVDGDTTLDCCSMPSRGDYNGTAILRLTLMDGWTPFSVNDYLVSAQGDGAYPDLQQIKTALIESSAAVDGESISLTLRNISDVPAMLLRINLKGADDEQILPVDYSDNYFHLMPGESKTVSIRWDAADARHQSPEIEISGYNVDSHMHVWE